MSRRLASKRIEENLRGFGFNPFSPQSLAYTVQHHMSRLCFYMPISKKGLFYKWHATLYDVKANDFIDPKQVNHNFICNHVLYKVKQGHTSPMKFLEPDKQDGFSVTATKLLFSKQRKHHQT